MQIRLCQAVGGAKTGVRAFKAKKCHRVRRAMFVQNSHRFHSHVIVDQGANGFEGADEFSSRDEQSASSVARKSPSPLFTIQTGCYSGVSFEFLTRSLAA